MGARGVKPATSGISAAVAAWAAAFAVYFVFGLYYFRNTERYFTDIV